jgi:hypothetical protein
MSETIPLATKLRNARLVRGWSIHGASERMGLSSHTLLRTLEGLNPEREPGGPDCKLSTVLTLVRAYWPDVTLDDFAGEELLFKLVPKDAKSNRRLKGYLSATG